MSNTRWDPERSYFNNGSVPSHYLIQSDVGSDDDYKADLVSLSNKLEGINLDHLINRASKTILNHDKQANEMVEYIFMVSDDPIAKFTSIAKDLQDVVFLDPRRLEEVDRVAAVLWDKIAFITSWQHKTT